MSRRNDSQQTINALVAKELQTLNQAIAEGFRGVHERQDTANGKLMKHSEEILLLKAAKWYERSLAAVVTVLVGVVVYFVTRN